MPQVTKSNSLVADRILLYFAEKDSSTPIDEKLVSSPSIDSSSTTEQLVTVSMNGEECTYDVVQVLEDETNKKRLFILVRATDKSMWLYCKGAKSEIFPQFSENNVNQSHTIFLHEGCNTLVARCHSIVQENASWHHQNENEKELTLLCAIGQVCSLQQMWDTVFPGKTIFPYREVQPEDMPYPFSTLLPFNHHMTHTLEAHYKQSTTLQVYNTSKTDDVYARAITLSVPGKNNQELKVQFALLYVFLQYLPEKAKMEVLAEKQPMGRILRNNKIDTRVQLQSVLHVGENEELSKYLSLPSYGRLAVIFCNGKPAIHVLEVLNKECY